MKQANTKVKDYLWKTLLHWRTFVSLLLLEWKPSSYPCTASAAESWSCIGLRYEKTEWEVGGTDENSRGLPGGNKATESVSQIISYIQLQGVWAEWPQGTNGGTGMKIGILLEVWIQTTFKTKNETRILCWNKGYAAKVNMNTEQLDGVVSVGPERDKKAVRLPWPRSMTGEEEPWYWSRSDGV